MWFVFAVFIVAVLLAIAGIVWKYRGSNRDDEVGEIEEVECTYFAPNRK